MFDCSKAGKIGFQFRNQEEGEIFDLKIKQFSPKIE